MGFKTQRHAWMGFKTQAKMSEVEQYRIPYR
jgi:hypothetical protein